MGKVAGAVGFLICYQSGESCRRSLFRTMAQVYAVGTAADAALLGSCVMTKTFNRWLPTLLLATVLPVVALAADADSAVTKQVGTASAHAGMALGAADLKLAHTHLHHVINCLVGPNGKGFDAQEEDPCKGMGQGAIVDAKGDAANESRLHAALTQAEHGVKATTLDAAHADAQQVLSTLQAK